MAFWFVVLPNWFFLSQLGKFSGLNRVSRGTAHPRDFVYGPNYYKNSNAVNKKIRFFSSASRCGI